MPIQTLFEGQIFESGSIAVEVRKPLNIQTWDEGGSCRASADEFPQSVQGKGLTYADALQNFVLEATCAQAQEKTQILIGEFLIRVPR